MGGGKQPQKKIPLPDGWWPRLKMLCTTIWKKHDNPLSPLSDEEVYHILDISRKTFGEMRAANEITESLYYKLAVKLGYDVDDLARALQPKRIEDNFRVYLQGAWQRHDIQQLHDQGTFLGGVLINDLVREAEAATDLQPLSNNSLIVGPPHVGKSCWSFRRIWRARDYIQDPVRLWFNVLSDQLPDDLYLLDQHLSCDDNYVLVIDDINTAVSDAHLWIRSVANFVARRPGRVRTVWISTDATALELLRIAGFDPTVENFPLEHVTNVFLESLDPAPYEFRLAAALLTGLDPSIGRTMASWSWEGVDSFDLLKTKVEHQLELNTREFLVRRVNQEEELYISLVPFGVLSYPIPENIISVISDTKLSDQDRLIQKGLCTRAVANGRIMLTQHPFQLRRVLAFVDKQALARERAFNTASGPGADPAVSFSARIVSRYLEGCEDPVNELGNLNRHADFVGLPEGLASAARYLSQNAKSLLLREAAQKVAMKLGRKSSPVGSPDVRLWLERDASRLNEWRDRAAAAPRETYEGQRLDAILYEEAYLHYLQERYEDAARIFRASVDACFRAIDRALGDPRRTLETEAAAAAALANIWIGGILECSSTARGQIRNILHGEQADHSILEQQIDQIAAIYLNLAQACQSGAEGLRTGMPFLLAAQKSMRADRPYPRLDAVVDLSHEPNVTWINRHLFNSCVHALETSGWPWLFGVESSTHVRDDTTLPAFEKVSDSLQKLDRGDRLGNRLRHAQLLHGAARGKQVKAQEAFHVAAMLHASGSFEYLGDHLLLAWKVAEDEGQRHAISWFMTNHVSDFGFNGLPKMVIAAKMRRP